MAVAAAAAGQLKDPLMLETLHSVLVQLRPVEVHTATCLEEGLSPRVRCIVGKRPVDASARKCPLAGAAARHVIPAPSACSLSGVATACGGRAWETSAS